MPGLVAIACLGGNGAILRCASSRLTRLLSSAAASVACVAANSLPQAPGLDGSRGSSINGVLPMLSDQEVHSNAFAQKPFRHPPSYDTGMQSQKVSSANGQKGFSLGPMVRALAKSGKWEKIIDILIAAPKKTALEIQELENCFQSLEYSNRETASKLLQIFNEPGEVEQIELAGSSRVDRPEKVLKAFKMIESTLHVTTKAAFYEYFIGKFCKLGQVSRALDLLEEMYSQKMRLDSWIFNPILGYLSNQFLLDEAFETLAAMRRMNIQPGIAHYNTVIRGCAMSGNMEKAYGLLAELQQYGKHPDKESFNLIIKGFCKQRRLKRAKSVLGEMVQAGLIPTGFTYSLLVHAYSVNKDFDSAMKMIKEMQDRGLETDRLVNKVMVYFRINSGNVDNVLKDLNR